MAERPVQAGFSGVQLFSVMASRQNRGVLIATGVFVLIAVLIKLAGGPLFDWLRALHGPAGGGGH